MTCDGWKFIRIDQNAASGSADYSVPEATLWVEGHFPGEPIVPGAALISHAWDVAREMCGPDIALGGLRRVKLMRIVRPGEICSISVRRQPSAEGEEISFNISIGGEKCCTGFFCCAAAQRKVAGK